MSENEHLVRIYDKLDEISKAVGSLTERTSLTEMSAKVHQESCKVRHADDGSVAKTAITKAVEWGVVGGLIIIAGRFIK